MQEINFAKFLTLQLSCFEPMCNQIQIVRYLYKEFGYLIISSSQILCTGQRMFIVQAKDVLFRMFLLKEGTFSARQKNVIGQLLPITKCKQS